ncbi:uncharacterized protein LOC102806100 [Saccoglossus kowalevskii]|uniref:3-hydroxybutyryl-CoA dehydratase-like protein, mitochondrial-like n=1 Tax=Saccoglossus kowalevskii TaxID=10224 RepID=A0ABM0MIW2_SACKO|nr:PREDICTED: 3-hydroxybutyryl-CoA dehydratase-like protein, mitochondrial-like [Saccoglossus kowalevskii]
MIDTSAKYRVEFERDIAILYMNDGENRYNLDSLASLHSALDQVEGNSEVKALISVGVGKFYSNGLDLDWLMEQDVSKIEIFHKQIHRLFLRFLVFPVPTIAAINGHCFAAGGFVALCHDFRIMQNNKGWFSLPEVHIHRPFEYPMVKILSHRIPPGKHMRDVGLLGKRYTAAELMPTGLLDGVAEGKQLLDLARTMAADLVKIGLNRQTYHAMKLSMYEDLVEALQYVTLQDPDLLKHRGKEKARL